MGKNSLKKKEGGFYTPIKQGEASGRKRSANLKSILKVQHLQKLATWASETASIPSLGALLGRQFAACSEASGITPDPSSIVTCQRCETILKPGFNCTVRIVKNQENIRRRCKKKPDTTIPKNYVIYSCHFCSYENAKRGTPRGYMQNICPSIPKITPQPEPPRHEEAAAISVEDSFPPNSEFSPEPETPTPEVHEAAMTSLKDCCPPNLELTPQPETPGPEVHETATTSLKDSCPPNLELTPQPETSGPELHEAAAATSSKGDSASKYGVKNEEEKTFIDTIENPSTPMALTGLTLLENKRKRGKSKAKKPDESMAENEQDAANSKKKRKKGWTSLKEIAQSKKSVAHLSVPFRL